MGAIWIILAARCRQGWRAWLLLTLLIALGTGLVLSAVTAGRRANAAFPGFVAAHGYDALVYSERPLPLAQLPDVTEAVETRTPFEGPPRCSCGKQIDDANFLVREVPPAALSRMVKLTSGRMPDQSDPAETLASFTLQRDYGVGPGTVIRLQLADASQRQQLVQDMEAGTPSGDHHGPVVTLRVTGIVAAENEFPSGQSAAYELYPTAAFAAATSDAPALPVYDVRLRHGAADFARFEATVSGQYAAEVDDYNGLAAAVGASIHPQAVAWWVVAALAALTFLVVTGQALSRQAAADDADGLVLAALGLRSRQFAALHLMRTLVMAVAGAGAGIAVATLLSPLVPVGEARLALSRPGLVFDGPVAGAGGAAVLAAVLLLGLPAALRPARGRAPERSAAVGRGLRVPAAAAAAGLPAVAVLGIRQALDRGRGVRAVPVRAGLAGAVAAVTALCAIAVFGASLSHLLAAPDLYGDPFQAFIQSSGPGTASAASIVSELKRDPAISRITVLTAPTITVDGTRVRALAAAAVRGPVLLSASGGRLPARDQEIALGATTLRETGAHIGGTVRVTAAAPDGSRRAAELRVVGTLPLPADAETGGLGTGAMLTAGGYLAVRCPATLAALPRRQCYRATLNRAADTVLLHAVPGPAGAAALARHARQHPGSTTTPSIPVALVSFGESASFPLLLTVVVAVAGVAALIHLMAVSVARRRRESGLLKTLGLVRPQLAAVVLWQAATVAVTGIAAGVPVGLLTGRVIWRIFAANLGVVPDTVVPGWLVAAIATGFLAVSLAIAVVPARTAAASPTAQLLRTE